MSSNKVPDFKTIYMLAEQYREASIVLEKNNKELSAPRLIVDSFAIELYLKCLYIIDKKQAKRGHDWKELFDALETNTKNTIRDEFKRIIKSDVVLSIYPELAEAGVIDKEMLKIIDFDKSLEAAKNTFVDIRYIYESNVNKGWFYTHLLRDSIANVANMIVPFAKK